MVTVRARLARLDASRASLGSVALFALCFALAGCGGTDDGRPAAAEPTAPETEPTDWCEVVDSFELTPIMDFEPTGVTKALCNPLVADDTASCKAYWNFQDDCHSPNSIHPGLGDVFGGDPIVGGRCGSPSQGLNIRAGDLGLCPSENGKVGWGGNAQLETLPIGDLLPGGGGCRDPLEGRAAAGVDGLDASCWDGVAFWAKRGSDSGGTAITVAVGDPSTNPGGDPACVSAASVVEAGTESSDTSKCDVRGIVVTLKDEWQFFTIPFGDLVQKGFGVQVPGPLDTGNLVKLQFLIAAGDWDLWLDDVSFYKTKE